MLQNRFLALLRERRAQRGSHHLLGGLLLRRRLEARARSGVSSLPRRSLPRSGDARGSAAGICRAAFGRLV